MGVCAVRIGRKGKKCLSTALMLLSLAATVSGLALLGIASAASLMIRELKELLKSSDYKMIEAFTVIMSIVLIVIHAAGAKICYDCNGATSRSVKTTKFILMPFMGVLVVNACCLLAFCVECRKSAHHLTKGFKTGFESLMENYGTDVNKKNIVDLIHIKHKCCGSTGYKSWLKIEWYGKEYLRPEAKKIKTNASKRGVPFTCCDPRKMGPCIHDIVEIQRPGYKLQKEKPFYNIGCGDVVMDNIKWILRALSLWVLLPFWIELVMMFLIKYLYTSVMNAAAAGDLEASSWGYLMEQCPCSCLSFLECDTMQLKTVKTTKPPASNKEKK